MERLAVQRLAATLQGAARSHFHWSRQQNSMAV